MANAWDDVWDDAPVKLYVGIGGRAGSGKTFLADKLSKGLQDSPHFSGVKVFNFADPVKSALQTMWNIDQHYLHHPEAKARPIPGIGVSGRALMQTFATEGVRDAMMTALKCRTDVDKGTPDDPSSSPPLFKHGPWILALKRRVDKEARAAAAKLRNHKNPAQRARANKPFLAVIADVRFMDELAYLCDNKALTFYVTKDPNLHEQSVIQQGTYTRADYADKPKLGSNPSNKDAAAHSSESLSHDLFDILIYNDYGADNNNNKSKSFMSKLEEFAKETQRNLNANLSHATHAAHAAHATKTTKATTASKAKVPKASKTKGKHMFVTLVGAELAERGLIDEIPGFTYKDMVLESSIPLSTNREPGYDDEDWEMLGSNGTSTSASASANERGAVYLLG